MRDEGLFVGGLFLIIMLLGYVFFTGFFYGSRVALAPALPAQPAVVATSISVPFSELAHGAKSTVKTRTNYLIKTNAELARLWQMVDAKGEAPKVDFTTNDVLAVFAGQKPTAGYSIAVAKVEDGALRIVTITLSSPDSTCLLAESLTAPYQIVTVRKTALDLTHKDVSTKTSCLP